MRNTVENFLINVFVSTENIPLCLHTLLLNKGYLDVISPDLCLFLLPSTNELVRQSQIPLSCVRQIVKFDNNNDQIFDKQWHARPNQIRA